MKKSAFIVIALVFAFSSITCGGSSSGGGGGGGGGGGTATGTVLKFTNTGAAQLILGFVSAAVGGACPTSSTLLTAHELANAGWCTNYQAGVDGAGKCLVTLDAGASVTVPNANGKCISGGFGAGGFASCGTTEYPNGWTQGEFTLNPTASTQEAVDISAVNGVNYPITIVFDSNDQWYYGPNQTMVGQVGPNNAFNQNVGVPGVFPNGCTDCIQLVGNPPCPDLTTSPTCQASRICNVYRDNAEGGTVEFQIGDPF